MNHVVLMSYLANSFNSLRTPIVPAKRPWSREKYSFSVQTTTFISYLSRYHLWNPLLHNCQAILLPRRSIEEL